MNVRNIQRDPRVVLTFDASLTPATSSNEYAMWRARAAVQPSEDAWNLLNRLAKVYMSPDRVPDAEGPGYIVRYSIERIRRRWSVGVDIALISAQ